MTWSCEGAETCSDARSVRRLSGGGGGEVSLRMCAWERLTFHSPEEVVDSLVLTEGGI
jgi:hypothetical protein